MTKFKVGDRVRVNSGFTGAAKQGATATVTGNDTVNGWVIVEWSRDGLDDGQRDGYYFPFTFDLIAQPGPVRTVTRREIVPGQYGAVQIWSDMSATVDVLDAAAAREAARLFNEIADALDENSKEAA